MSILFSGDFHAGAAGELPVITKKSLIKKYGEKRYNGIKYHIMLGDGGFMWPGNEKTDRFNYKALSRRPFPVLCVLGNHEPVYGILDKMELADIGIGGGVYKIHDFPFTAYLQRGKAYVIDGVKTLALGGALSIDKHDRTEGKTWWKNEYWTEEERAALIELLERERSFDCVLSHTGPDTINQRLFHDGSFDHLKFRDEVALFNARISGLITFKQWYSGHWHRDRRFCDHAAGRNYYYLYRTTKILEKKDGVLSVFDEYGETA